MYSDWITVKASGMVREVSVHVDGRGHNINACDDSDGQVTDFALIIFKIINKTLHDPHYSKSMKGMYGSMHISILYYVY